MKCLLCVSDSIPGVLEAASGAVGVRVGSGGHGGRTAADAAQTGVRDQMHRPQAQPRHPGKPETVKLSNTLSLHVFLPKINIY